MAKIAIIRYAEDEYDIHEVYDMTPEEIKLVKNIIKQIKTNEKTKGFSWSYNRGKNAY